MEFLEYHESHFLADGANNAIFQVAGAPWVLRFAKYDKSQKTPSGNREKYVNLFNCDDCVNFYNNIICNTFGKEYLFSRLSLEYPNLRVSAHVKEQFHLHTKRPEKQCSLILDNFIVMPDITRLRDSWDGDSYCLEIKPKCGFINLNADFSNHPYTQYYCRFCLQQFSKIKSSIYDVSNENEFCPLDLFSTCHTRIIRACTALFKTPQNNLKIFKNSVHENIGTFNEEEKDFMKHALYQAIVANSFEDPGDFDFSPNDFCAKSQKPLCCLNDTCEHRSRGGILDNIHKMQRVDKAGIEKVMFLWQNMSQEEKHRLTLELKNFSSPLWTSLNESIKNRTFENDPAAIIRNFLFSMTFRDCSFAVIFSKCTKNDRENSPGKKTIFYKGEKFYFIIKAIDFDPRSPLNIPFYYTQSIDIYHRFIKEFDLDPCSRRCEKILM